jgi:hypothetical protein
MAVPRLEEYQLQFDQVYDGAYRYLDRCGEFMAKVQQAAGFTPLSATPNNCTMEVVEQGLQLRGSIEMMVLVCTQPENAAEWIRSAEYCSKQAIELFEPRSIVYNQIISRSIWRTKSLEDSYRLSLAVPKESLLGRFADLLQMTPLNQECFFSFQSGTHKAHVRVQPISITIAVAERKLPLPGASKRFSEYLLKKEKSLQSNPQQPAYGLGLEVTVVENDPPAEGSIQKLHSTLLNYRKRIVDDIRIL